MQVQQDNAMAKDTLIRNIGEAIYKDKKSVMKMVRARESPLGQGLPHLAARASDANNESVQVRKMGKALEVAKEVEFGFKIRDKSNPEQWWAAKDVILIPAEDNLPKLPMSDVGSKASDLKG